MQSTVRFLESGIGFRAANDAGDIVYLAHCVASCGSYLARLAHVPHALRTPRHDSTSMLHDLVLHDDETQDALLSHSVSIHPLALLIG